MISNTKSTIVFDAELPLTQDVDDFFYKLNKTFKDNIKQNLKMLLYTAPGERVMAPQYGVGIRRFLFEQYPDYRIDEKIREQVSRYLPQVSIVSLNISRGDTRTQLKTGQSNALTVELIYEINEYNFRDSIILVDTVTST